MAKITPADIVIRAQDKTKPGITSAKKGVGGLTSAVKSYGAEMAAVYLVVRQVASAMIQLSKEAAYLKQINMAFESMAEAAGESSEEMLEAMRELSGGTISTMEMIQSANRAMVLGLPIDKLDDMMKIARASSTATGESVKKMFDDIVVGIGRQSRMILDNLGIIVKTEEANQDYAEAMGIVGRELTDVEKRQAFMNATLEAGKEIIEKVGEAGQEITSAERWQRMTASIADLRAEAGMRLLPAFERITEEITGWSRGLAENLKLTRELKEAWELYQKALGIAEEERVRVEIEALVKQTEKMIEVNENLIKIAVKTIEKTGGVGRAAAMAKTRINTLTEANTELVTKLGLLEDQLVEVIEQEVKAKKPTEELVETVERLWKNYHYAYEELVLYTNYQNYAIARTEDMKDGIKDLVPEIKDLTQSYVDFGEGIRNVLPMIEDLNQAAEDQAMRILPLWQQSWMILGDSTMDVAEKMKEIFKNLFASILEMLGKELLVWAVKALIPLAGLFNPAGAAAAFAGSALAFAGAGYIRSLQQGGVVKKQLGGFGGGDTIPAMLEPGEMVIRKEVARVNRPALEAMNAGEQQVMLNNTINIDGRTFFKILTRASRNKQFLTYAKSVVE